MEKNILTFSRMLECRAKTKSQLLGNFLSPTGRFFGFLVKIELRKVFGKK